MANSVTDDGLAPRVFAVPSILKAYGVVHFADPGGALMLSGFEANIVAVCVEGCEVLCLPCASKRLGEPRCARVIAGLESRGGGGLPRPESQYQINEAATDNGYECSVGEEGRAPADSPRGSSASDAARSAAMTVESGLTSTRRRQRARDAGSATRRRQRR